MSANIGVFLCEDDHDFRTLARLWIEAEDDLSVVGECGSLEETIEQLGGGLAVEAILLDHLLPGETVGAEAVQ